MEKVGERNGGEGAKSKGAKVIIHEREDGERKQRGKKENRRENIEGKNKIGEDIKKKEEK